MGLFGILLGLGLLVWLAYRGWTILLAHSRRCARGRRFRRRAAACLLDAAFMAGRDLSRSSSRSSCFRQTHGRQRFGRGDCQIHVRAIGAAPGDIDRRARWCVRHLWRRQPVRCVFVLVPMAQALFRGAGHSQSLDSRPRSLWAPDLHDAALPGTPAIQNAIPIPFFGTTPLAAPALGMIAAAIMLAFGLWWLGRAEAVARRKGEGFGAAVICVRRRRGRGRDAAPARHDGARVRPTGGPSRPPERARCRRSLWRRCRFLWWSASMS